MKFTNDQITAAIKSAIGEEPTAEQVELLNLLRQNDTFENQVFSVYQVLMNTILSGGKVEAVIVAALLGGICTGLKLAEAAQAQAEEPKAA